MRIVAFFFITLVLLACNNPAKDKVVTPDGGAGTKDTTGEVNGMPQPAINPDTIFTGFGNEPFWAVYVIAGSKIVFHPADGTDVELPFVTASLVNDSTSLYQSASPGNSIELLIIKQDCSDGMSDLTHPYAITLTVNKNKYTGCGRMGK